MFADARPQLGQTRWKHPAPSRTASGLTPQHFPTIKSAISPCSSPPFPAGLSVPSAKSVLFRQTPGFYARGGSRFSVRADRFPAPPASLTGFFRSLCQDCQSCPIRHAAAHPGRSVTLPHIPPGPSRCRVSWPCGMPAFCARVPPAGYIFPARHPFPAPKNFRRVCAMRGAGLWSGHFRGIGMGRGPAPPVEPQRRQFPADPIVHRIMARLTKPDQVPAAIAILREILHRPSVMRHSSRCSPAIACAVLAGTAS